MGEFSDYTQEEFKRFASVSLAPLVAVIVRAVHDAALAYDLATETLAAARWRWESGTEASQGGQDRAAWLTRLAASILTEATERKRVPSVERRRHGGDPLPRTLTVIEQQEIAHLVEARLELTPAAREAADALARSAPPRHELHEIRLSGLVRAQPLPDREPDRHEG